MTVQGRRGWRLLLVVVVVTAWCGGVEGISTCDRRPSGTTSPRTSGDNDFSIKISSNSDKYFPGELYTVSLEGLRRDDQYNVKRFTAFLLLVESMQPSPSFYSRQSVGTFRLFDDALIMHSEDCPNAIVQTSSVSKQKIQVMWNAPPASSGCVKFKAMVVESRDVWYMDDGELTKVMCEDTQDGDQSQPPVIADCCACDEAKYEVTFEGLWSRQTHPKNFPLNEWLTHFSDIIGASHSNDYRVWKYGDYASDGLREVAEWGSTRALESELKQQSGQIRTIIKARGLWHPNLNGKTFAVFRVDTKHHLMSLVSMFGPTPDWIVGVSALELCLANCSWVGQKMLNLYPWDAGTDSGITYESGPQPSIPREKIRRITSSYPKNDKAPFYDPTGKEMKPLARLTITRQRVYEKSCDDPGRDHFPDDPIIIEPEEPADERPVCRTTEWSEFTPCSATCGKGRRQRTRQYLMPDKAAMMDCQTQLVSDEMCLADQHYCDGAGPWQQPNLQVCQTSEWSPWTTCTATCGAGFRMRNRYYLDRMGRKLCTEELTQKTACERELPECNPDEEEVIPEGCAVTSWTEFTHCSVTCGTGKMTRSRQYLRRLSTIPNCSVNTLEERPCQGIRPSCELPPEEAQEVCLLPKVNSRCRGTLVRYYFDAERRRCMDFQHGGCRTNRNNFETLEECLQACEHNPEVIRVLDELPLPLREDVGIGGHYPGLLPSLPGPPSESQVTVRRNCKMSAWSEWSQCSATCGLAFRTKTRSILIHPHGGGRKCPRKMERKRKCKRNPRCARPDDPFTNNGFGGLESHSLRRDPDIFLLPPSPTTTTTTTTTTPRRPPPYRPETPNPLLPYHPDQEYIAPALFNPPSLLGESGGLGVVEAPDFSDYTDGAIVDCEMSEWGPWSPCTHSCGPESLQQRSRNVVRPARGSGAPCGDRYERRYCHLPPCNRPRQGVYLAARPYH